MKVGKLVIFEIGEGSFETGFPVKIRIGEQGKTHRLEISGRLPASPDLPSKYYEWQSIYHNLPANWLITIPKAQITNVSTIGSCQHAASRFLDSFNEWLNTASVRKLERQLLLNIQNWQQTRLILQTKNSLLLRFPWHLWEMFEGNNYQPEIVIASEYEPAATKLKSPVKILAVFGDSTGINVETDLQALEQKLPDANIYALKQPRRKELMDCLWNRDWDILFFAGHSSSQAEDSWGEIKLNSEENLLLVNFRYALQNAVKKGLKLAIFNSCDGLGLARNLADLRIPYTIVMREPVPDIVAQNFLEYFLTAFARGESLYASVKEARTRLFEELDGDYPCASWLPILFQNPAATVLKYPRSQNWSQIFVKANLLLLMLAMVSSLTWLIGREISFSNRFSAGDKILDNKIASPEKIAGINQLKSQNYELAIQNFEKALKNQPDDPETLIYLNNSQAENQGRNTSQAPVQIGLAVPIGSSINVAREIMRGVAQAQREINRQGGLNGRLLKVVIANDDNQAEIAEEIARRFVNRPDIQAVVGHNSSDASVPAGYIYQNQGLVMISPTSSSTQLTEIQRPRGDNYIYRTIVNHGAIINRLTDYLKYSGMERIGICRDTKAKEHSTLKSFEDSIRNRGLTKVDLKCDFGLDRFNPEDAIKDAESKQVDAIYLDPQIDRLYRAFKLAEVNQGKFLLLGNSSFQTVSTLNHGRFTKGMVLAVTWEQRDLQTTDFVKDAEQLWHNKNGITWRTANAFDATKVIAIAMSKTANINRQNIQTILANGFVWEDGVTGKIEFTSQGDRISNHPGTLLQVRPDPKYPDKYDFGLHSAVQSRLSQGEQILMKSPGEKPNSAKQAGVNAYAAGNYSQAIAYFQKALHMDSQDPETWIYLQNSRAAALNDTLKIAVVVPIGSNLSVSRQILQGIAQAQLEINTQGGIKGKLLQIVIANDDNQAEIAQQIAYHFREKKQEILAVIGSNASNASVAACGIYQQSQIVNISPTSFSLELSGCGNYIFRTSPNVRFIADVLSKYAVQTAKTQKLAICVDEQAKDNQSFRDEFTFKVQEYGGQIVKIFCDFSYDQFQPDKIIQDAKNQGAQGILLAPHIDRIEQALKLAASNQGQLKLYGSTSLFTPQTIQQGKANINGLIVPATWHLQAQLNPEFNQKAQTMWGENNITWRTATSYDAAMTIIRGLQRSNTPQDLQKTLSDRNFSTPGATGTIQFFQSGDRDNKNNALLLQVQPSPTSADGYDFILVSSKGF